MGSKTKVEFIARGLCLSGSKVLLCRNVKHDYYYLPGGHIDFGEPATTALAREFMEETGVVTSIGPLLLVSEHTFFSRKGKPHHELNLVFHVEHLDLPVADSSGGDQSEPPTNPSSPPPIQSQEDHLAFDWVELAAIPEADVRPPEIKAWLSAGGQVEMDEEQDSIGWLSNCDPKTLPEG